MSKIIILAGSVRRNGNTQILAESLADGAECHNTVEIISMADYNVNPCIGCNACYANSDNECFQKDDMEKIVQKIVEADILVIASPVYFYGVSAQLKAVIDRFHSPVRNRFKFKKMALLLVGADNLPELFDSIERQYELCLKYFNLEDVGRVLVRGVEEKGEINGKTALKEAYELGYQINNMD